MSVDDEVFDSDCLEPEHEEFVPAVFARSLGEAEAYRELLTDHEIAARVGTDEAVEPAEADGEPPVAERRRMTHGVPVLVPESLLDEASEIIADREDFSEYDDDEDEDEEDEEDDDSYGLGELNEGGDAFLEDDEDEDDDLFSEADELDELGEEDEEEHY
jgi:hypothetical protein